MAYRILAINPGHNGSAALVEDGNIIFYAEEERFSRAKYDGNPFRAMTYALELLGEVDELIIAGTYNEYGQMPWTGDDAYTALAKKYSPNIRVTKLGHMHHYAHACNAFYNSGFRTAAAVVVDGAGSYHTESMGQEENAPTTGGYETESIFLCGYPNEISPVYKRYADGNTVSYDNGLREFDDSVTITKAYEAVTNYLGFHFIEAGKTMGLAPYGHRDDNIPPIFINGKGNKNLLRPAYPMGATIDEFRFPYLVRRTDSREWHGNETMVDEKFKNLAWHVQQETQQLVARLIQKAVDNTGETNIVISGGYGLNCVANYFYKQTFPNLNIYVDPISHDGGTALGLALLAWYIKSNDRTPRNRISNLYLSRTPNYANLEVLLKDNPSFNIVDTTSDDVAKLIADRNIVAMFQGRAEAGPRALGNRSILYDPRDPDGKAFVNQVKGREWFRPFAGSALKEHAQEWFDLAGMDETPFMMYAVNVAADKLEQVPAITHVDNTCRVQTVSETDNPNYHALIKSFYALTGVPVVFNTSFNLAGDPLVETLVDAFNAVLNSDIKYLYLPEISKLIIKGK